ncbi:MAG: hypothetical protein DI585_04000 [Pseudomonas fluorescens]|nr:MAG: hypothetical protein DI585_04000 [Pseudomonas fluorescens]
MQVRLAPIRLLKHLFSKFEAIFGQLFLEFLSCILRGLQESLKNVAKEVLTGGGGRVRSPTAEGEDETKVRNESQAEARVTARK